MPEHRELTVFNACDRPALFGENTPIPPGGQIQHNIRFAKGQPESKLPRRDQPSRSLAYHKTSAAGWSDNRLLESSRTRGRTAKKTGSNDSAALTRPSASRKLAINPKVVRLISLMGGDQLGTMHGGALRQMSVGCTCELRVTTSNDSAALARPAVNSKLVTKARNRCLNVFIALHYRSSPTERRPPNTQF